MAKSKLRLLKKRENQELEKTFEDYAQELEKDTEGNAKDYIPKMCERAEIENPGMSNAGIRKKVVDRLTGVLVEAYIRKWLPKKYKDQVMAERGKLGKEAQMDSYQKHVPTSSGQNDVSADDLNREEEDSPVQSYTPEEYEEEHPKIEESPFQALGEINRAIARLWTALTANKNMPTMEDDLKKDFIIPARQRAKDIVNGSSKIERDFLFNWLTWLGSEIADWKNIVANSDSTAYDTRKGDDE